MKTYLITTNMGNIYQMDANTSMDAYVYAKIAGMFCFPENVINIRVK